jgi:hypothetical protein
MKLFIFIDFNVKYLDAIQSSGKYKHFLFPVWFLQYTAFVKYSWVNNFYIEDHILVQVYPMLVWDTFPHAGASQIHPHFQARVLIGQHKAIISQ